MSDVGYRDNARSEASQLADFPIAEVSAWARIVSAIEARCEQLSRGDKSDREGAEWGRAGVDDAEKVRRGE